MFVKLCTDDYDPEARAEILYQCDEASVHPKNKDEVYLTIIREKHVVTQLELNKIKTAIYIMNDDGKTISNYRWMK